MKKIIFILLMICSTQSFAEMYSGIDLKNGLESSDLTEQTIAHSIINTVVDSITTLESTEHIRLVCGPTNTTYQKVHTIILNSLNAHSETRYFGASRLVISILKEKYPCIKNKS